MLRQIENARCWLTADKDFGELIFRQRLHTHGTALIRLAGLSPHRKAEIVASVVTRHAAELPRAFAVIAPRIVRIRRVGE
ncbi:MAG: DUF5615 family PIN-like protein [Nitrospira sp.]